MQRQTPHVIAMLAALIAIGGLAGALWLRGPADVPLGEDAGAHSAAPAGTGAADGDAVPDAAPPPVARVETRVRSGHTRATAQAAPAS